MPAHRHAFLGVLVVLGGIVAVAGVPAAAVAATDGDHTVAVTVDDTLGIETNETVHVWTGTVNRSGQSVEPVANTSLTVTVFRAGIDRVVREQTVDTDANGSAVAAFDSDDLQGRYRVEVTGQSGRATDWFRVGPITTGLRWRNQEVTVGNTINTTVSVTDGGHPVTGAERRLRIVGPSGEVTTETVTTDADGLATMPFTPTEPGRYTLTNATTNVTIQQFEATHYTTVVIDHLETQRQRTGQPAEYAGILQNASGPVADQPLTMAIRDQSTGERLGTVETRTDANGMFSFEWNGTDRSTALDIEGKTPAGETVPFPGGFQLEETRPAVTDDVGTDAETETPTLDLDVVTASTDDPGLSVAPNGRIQITGSLRDSTGSPVANTTVDAVLRIGRHGPPSRTIDLRTDEAGRLNRTLSLPAGLPHGNAVILTGRALVNGSAVTDRDVGPTIAAYSLTTWSGDLTPGETESVFVTAERPNGSAAPGVPFTAALVGESRYGPVVTDSGVTDADGEAHLEFDLPTAMPPHPRLVELNRYSKPGGSGIEDATGPATLEIDRSEVAPGETVTLSYQTPANTTGIVTVGDWQTAVQFVATDENETVQVQIPETAIDTETITVSVLAVDGDGRYYETDRRIDLTWSPPQAIFHASPGIAQTGDVVTFDAEATRVDNGTYTWSFDDGTTQTTQSARVTHSFESAGRHAVTLTVTNDTNGSDTFVDHVRVVENDSESDEHTETPTATESSDDEPDTGSSENSGIGSGGIDITERPETTTTPAPTTTSTPVPTSPPTPTPTEIQTTTTSDGGARPTMTTRDQRTATTAGGPGLTALAAIVAVALAMVGLLWRRPPK